MGFENGKLVRVILRAATSSDQQVNTFHYDLQDAPAQPANDPQSLADTFRDDVLPHFVAQYSSAWLIQPVEVIQELDPQNPLAPRSSWTSGTETAGTRAESTDLLPRPCCTVVKLNTAKIGRRFAGRTFVGGSNAEVEQAAGVWTTAQITLVNTLMSAIPLQPDIAELGSDSTANWCVYSRTQRAADLDPYAEHITSYTIRTLVHWLRSRQQ
jgi:hypothetical protein